MAAKPSELGGEVTEGGGADDFEDIVDSPHGPDLHRAQVGSGDDIEHAEAEFSIVQGGSAEELAFDNTVGALQDIVMSEEFQTKLDGFCKEHCEQFEDSEENKLIYTDIFKKYSELIEGYLEKQLKDAVPGFDMSKFLEDLTKRGEEELDNSMFDLLVSLGDFDSFKQQMLAAKVPKENLAISGVASKIYHDEDEEGEERPDLGDLLVVSSPKAK